MASSVKDLLATPLPGLDDLEGRTLPNDLPPVVDGHIHLFPDRIFEALWRWFEQYGWPIRYPLHSPQVIEFLLSRGVQHLVALHYSHKPGLAVMMNRYMAALSEAEPRLTCVATVLPGEPDAAQILAQGFAMGLRGVKLHCHVQCFSPDDPSLQEIYEVCVQHDQPLVMHAGREPKSPAYACDPHEICGVERIERVLQDHPKLRLCVPHLGVDEFAEYTTLLEKYDGLWLDTTMVLADYFPVMPPLDVLFQRPDRIIYGTDFPNIPYAWDREIRNILTMKFPPEMLEALLHKNATHFYQLPTF
ncbi:MAG: amidohydrolase [Myxococcales bacterium]|nr:amidohydrolase [Myxococcales bacterium]MCB9644074.1 amidohydrolase [Myxococcales bacterium]